MRRMGGLLALALVGLLGLAHPFAALAQDEEPLQLSDLDGVQTAVSRTYTIDFEAMFAAEASSTPEASGTLLYALGGSIVQFDSEDKAKTGYIAILDEVQSQESSATPEDLVFETVDLGTDLGDERTGLRAAGDESGLGGDLIALLVRDGSTIYLITGIANTGDPSDSVVAFAKSVIDAKASDDEATFNEDGTSTGGLWDKFPSTDDPVVAGLPSVIDTDPMDPESGM